LKLHSEVEEVEVSRPRDAVMPPEAFDEKAEMEPLPESREMKEEPEVKEDIIYEKEVSAGRERAEEAPVEGAIVEKENEVEKSVKETLNSFKEELKESISSSVKVLDTDEYIRQTLQMSSEDLNRMQVLANSGIARAAESLSKIVKKRIDLSIPEVRILPLEKIPESIGEIDSVYMGVYMPLEGNIRGTILFSLLEDSGFDLVTLLYGAEAKGVKELSEDGESALTEVTNIVGSSVVNEFSEQTELVIKPTVPTLVHDYMQSILDSILVLHNISNDFALIMNTVFYYQDETIIGNLLILPETDSLKVIVNRLRE
jgi:chemotaxis protein CheC